MQNQCTQQTCNAFRWYSKAYSTYSCPLLGCFENLTPVLYYGIFLLSAPHGDPVTCSRLSVWLSVCHTPCCARMYAVNGFSTFFRPYFSTMTYKTRRSTGPHDVSTLSHRRHCLPRQPSDRLVRSTMNSPMPRVDYRGVATFTTLEGTDNDVGAPLAAK